MKSPDVWTTRSEYVPVRSGIRKLISIREKRTYQACPLRKTASGRIVTLTEARYIFGFGGSCVFAFASLPSCTRIGSVSQTRAVTQGTVARNCFTTGCISGGKASEPAAPDGEHRRNVNVISML